MIIFLLLITVGLCEFNENNEQCVFINSENEISKKLDMINDRLDIIIKFKRMNRTDEEIKQDFKDTVLVACSIFGVIIAIMLLFGLMAVCCP